MESQCFCPQDNESLYLYSLQHDSHILGHHEVIFRIGKLKIAPSDHTCSKNRLQSL